MGIQLEWMNSSNGVADDSRYLSFRLPRGATIRGYVMNSLEPQHLREDLARVDLPSGVGIDVGWYPMWDPAGEYVVTVFAEDDWDNLLQDEAAASTPWALKEVVEELAAYWTDRRVAPLSADENARLRLRLRSLTTRAYDSCRASDDTTDVLGCVVVPARSGVPLPLPTDSFEIPALQAS